MTKGIPTDPSLASQWHLVGAWGLHADQVWSDYTGEGVLVAVFDDGFEHTHHELAANYRTDLDRDVFLNSDVPGLNFADRHGTAVMGTIIADDNGAGTVGVAFDAEGFGIRQDFTGAGTLDDIVEGFQYALTRGADVMNNSWGFTAVFSDDAGKEFAGTDFYAVRNAMIDLVEDGRGGLGTNIVISAGNDRTTGDNVNYHNLKNTPYSITVAAHASNGTIAGFSTPGAAILVSAGGVGDPTTDRTGAAGYHSASDYTNFNGTSASAPVVSGLVALMLEANPDLGWRDVQEILAYSSRQNNPGGGSWQYNGAANWNGGGLHFSHDFGFGGADALRAIRLAETWAPQQTSANMTTISSATANPALALPDLGTVTTTINMAQDIDIEHVLIDLDISHAKAGDLIVTLISPDGTESTLINRPSNGAFTSIYGVTGIDFETMSNAHWGESSAGIWTLRIQDMVAGNTGTLNSWKLTFTGDGAGATADDQYIFSDDFGAFAGAELAARSAISDADGGTDSLNLAMVTTASAIDLTAGTGTIAGDAVTVAGGTVIENVYGGDGNDDFTGNASANELYGGRGDDTLQGMGGNDTLDGGAGTDTADYSAAVGEFNFSFVDAQTVVANHVGALGSDTLRNIENFMFAGINYTRAALEALVGGGALSDIVMTFTSGLKTFQFTSSFNETEILTANEMNFSTAQTNYVQLTRNNASLTVNYLSTTAPNTLRIDGENAGETILITGVRTGLIAQVFAGGGDDTVTVSLAATATIHGGDGHDTVTGNIYRDTLNGNAGNDTLNGGGNTDTLNGGDDNDTLNGDAGNDILNGDAGNDALNGGDGYDTLNGGAGDDTLTGGLGIDYMYGGDGADTVNSGAESEKLYGGNGDDTLNGNAGNDYLYGEADNDTLNGGAGVDRLYGGAGNDAGNGGDDADYIYGEAGDDTLAGGAGADKLYGADGNDTLNGDADNDYIYGGAGSDTISGGHGIDTMRGEAGNDSLDGGDGADRIYGGTENDSLSGGAANDILYGEAGDDFLAGGAGLDTLYGGAGNDIFGFTTMGDGLDAVRDFAAGDRLDVADLLTGFGGGDDIDLFVRMTGSSTKTFSINADGAGNDFVAAFTAGGSALSGQTVQSLFDAGLLIAS